MIAPLGESQPQIELGLYHSFVAREKLYDDICVFQIKKGVWESSAINGSYRIRSATLLTGLFSTIESTGHFSSRPSFWVHVQSDADPFILGGGPPGPCDFTIGFSIAALPLIGLPVSASKA